MSEMKIQAPPPSPEGFSKKHRNLLLASLLLLLATIPFLGIVPISHADSPNVKYGTFYYVWYDGYGDTSHFNGTPPNNTGLPSTWWTVIDQPLLGFYFSNDTRIIKAQFAMMHEAGIDFVLVSWWGWSDESDNNTKIVFDTMEDILPYYNMQIAISVEPINESGVYNFTAIQDYIYQNFVTPYNSSYMKLDGKPLLTWMQGGTMTNSTENQNAIHSDSRFTSRIIGDMSYVDWYWWFPNNERPDQKEPLLSPQDGGETCILPRYDDSRLGEGRNTTDDPDYSEGLYQKQWNVANAWIKKGQCDIVLIGTWNDYTERTQIEPCFDATSFTPYPFYLLNITRANIEGISQAVAITNVSQNPPTNNVTPTDAVSVNTTVTDGVGTVTQVSLNYTNGNGTWITANMTNLQGNTWNSIIPAFPYGTNVTYIVQATDSTGNTVTIRQLGYTLQYTIVTPEFTALPIVFLFLMAILSAVVFHKQSRHRKGSSQPTT